MRRLTGRRKTENESRHNRDYEGEDEDFAVDRDGVGMCDVVRNEAGQHMQPGIGEAEADHTAEQRKHHAFDE